MQLIEYVVKHTDLVERTNTPLDAFSESVYIARGVHDELQKRNERITELERALRSNAHVLSQMMLRHSALDGLAKEALNEADKALALMETST